MRAELRDRDGQPVATVDVPATPAPPGVVLYGERYYRRTVIDGFGARVYAIYTEGELMVLPSEAAREGGAS